MAKIGFLGIGAAGSNVCEIAELYGYRTAIINTSQEDLDSISLIKNKLLLGTKGGAGKDRNFAKEDVKQYYNDIVKFVEDKFHDDDIKMIYVTFSTSGGTGSGASPLIIALLRKLMPQKKFGAVVVLPAKNESVVAQVNSVECQRELVGMDIPVVIADNEKVSAKDPNLSRKSLYDNVNNQIIMDFNAVFSTERKASKYGIIDGQDTMKLLSTPGVMMIGNAEFERKELADGMNIQKHILKSWDDSVYAPLEYDRVIKRIGYIFEVDDSVTKNLKLEELYQEIGKPLEVFEGFHKPEDTTQTVITILTGLSFPEGRMKEVTDMLEKDKESFNIKKDYDLLKSADMSWFNDARSEATITPQAEEKKEQSLEDLFNQFN